MWYENPNFGDFFSLIKQINLIFTELKIPNGRSDESITDSAIQIISGDSLR